MARGKERNTTGRKAYCTSCREEFLVYNTTVEKPECPFCGRRVRSAVQRHLRSCGIALLVIAVAAGAIGLWWILR